MQVFLGGYKRKKKRRKVVLAIGVFVQSKGVQRGGS